MPSRSRSGLVRLLLLRPRRSFGRRPRFQIFGDRVAILRPQLRGVLDHGDHQAAGAVAVRRLAALEKISDVLGSPVADALLCDIGSPALAIRIGSTGETLRSDDAA